MTGTEERQIVYNAVKCLVCKETIVSYHVHDYKNCGCSNAATVDGGTYYLRYGAKDMNKIELKTIFADDDFSLVRDHAARGSRGVDGKQPLTWLPISEMKRDHIEAVLVYGGADWHLDILRKELKYRDEKGIKH